MLFSVQLAGANLRHANLTGSRLIGDLRKTDLSGAILRRMNAAADMRNQSMGLMHTVMVNARAIAADFSNSDFSRADFSFADLSDAHLHRTQLVRCDFSGTTLSRADLSEANLQEAQFIDTDFANANLTNADFSGASFRGVRGLDTATTKGARGLP
jgi:uncharacterized protein YjbI with pentapeptide repeats